MVLGHHPHVIQPIEIYRTARGDDVPILYSLGNLTPVFSHPATALSLIVRLRLVRAGTGRDGQVRVGEVQLTPVALVSSGQGARPSLRLVRLSALLGSPAAAQMQPYTAEMAAYADRILGEGWRRPAGRGAS
jgi:poly-gamma-glutamate synthesis protein (capsule biosynthesis protein)